jgi:hypothetical protein
MEGNLLYSKISGLNVNIMQKICSYISGQVSGHWPKKVDTLPNINLFLEQICVEKNIMTVVTSGWGKD